MKKALVFYDAHDTPGSNKRRFHWLGQLACDTEPDLILQGGDFCSMEALSAWDRDKRQLIEGRRVQDDFKSAGDSWGIVQQYIKQHQQNQRRRKVAVWKPDLAWLHGNHEDWVRQYVERNPEFDGMLNYEQFLNIDRNLFNKTTIVPWKEVFAYESVLFSHAPIGRTGPIHSKYITARALADLAGATFVFGHTHRNQCDSIARYNSEGNLQYIRSINAGCFFEDWPHYAEGNTNDYWCGVMLLYLGGDGHVDKEEWSMERLKYVYGPDD